MTQIDLSPLPGFANRLRRQRRASGMKQSTLAELLGLDQATVSRWENGRNLPGPDLQRRALRQLSDPGGPRGSDAALRRLIERAAEPLHLIEDASHRCLAYSAPRAREWGCSQQALLGQSLWRFATPEIQEAEVRLDGLGWWDRRDPDPVQLRTSGARYAELVITPGAMVWERLYLSDGTPVRLARAL